MLILPLKTDLSLNQQPVATYTVMMLCIVIYAADANGLYYPDTFDPLMMIYAGLSHADWWHVLGNLLFFFAFTTALELLVGSTLKFIGVLVLIEIVCAISYSIVSLIDSSNVPTLGLSGVVTGMIGLSAFLMPWARIRTFVWFFYFAKTVSIPAWMLAVWYIGFDTYDLLAYSDHGGINLIAHVSGGFAGYFIGHIWFKDRKIEIQEELDDEIEYARSLRDDKLGILSSYKGSKNTTNNAREKLGKQEFANYVDSVYRQINLAHDSEAILAMLEKYDQYHKSVEIYEELFQEIKHADKSRAILCAGRLTISLLIEQQKYGRALKIAEQCLDISKIFVLADPNAELMLLKKKAMESHQYKLAYRLICNSELRYGNTIDTIQYQLMEAQILWYHLADTENAREIVKKLQQREMGANRVDILALAGQMESSI